jgi:hypothetical protein
MQNAWRQGRIEGKVKSWRGVKVSTCVGFASLSASRNVKVPDDRSVSKRMRAHCVSALFMKIRFGVGGVQVGAPGWASVEGPQEKSVAVGLGDSI